ncbi:MAG: ABC transporter permease [Planctomycetes bacterium]|nr:ABC transporter permease [Planctomycetota bacterium]
MRPLSVLSEALGSLRAHPLRSALTMLSVTFGAAALHVLLAYATGMPDTTATILRSLGGKEFIVEPRHARTGGVGHSDRRVRIRYVDLPAIEGACPSVAAVAPMYRPGRGGPIFGRDKSWPWASVIGVGFTYREVTDLRIVNGRWFTEEEEAASEELALLSLPLVEGMYDGVPPLGESIDCNGRRFTIIGTYESQATFAYSLLVPYPTAMEMGDDGGRYVSQLAFAPRRPDLASDAISQMRLALASLYDFDADDTGAIDIKENTAFVEKVAAASFGLEMLVLTIAGLTLVLGCLGAANVVGIAVAERTSELGLRKALGATPARVRAEVLTETLLLCTLGGALGVALGAAATALLGPLPFTDEARLVPRADETLLLASFVTLVVVAVLAGLPAANRAARVDPVVALRDE